MSRRHFGWAAIAVSLLAAACSNNKPAPTVTPVPPPNAASNLYFPRTGTSSIVLRWKDNSDSEYGFRIERHSALSPSFIALRDTVRANQVTFEDFSVTADSTYTYRVVAYNAEGSAPPSNEATVEAVENQSPKNQSPPTPADGATEIDPQSPVNLHWTFTDADGDPITYDVFFGATIRSMTLLSAAQTDTTYTLPGPFERNSHYFWQVVAHDPKGVSTPSRIWGFNTVADRDIVPAGYFVMGDRREFGPIDSTYVHPGGPIYVDAFSIDRYEITNQQFADFLNLMLIDDSLRVNPTSINGAAGGHVWAVIRPNDLDSDITFSVADNAFLVQEGRENFPVVQVSWYGADAYARFYNRRLPTEAEWEKAARGTSRLLGYLLVADSSSVDTVGIGLPFPWGTQQDLSRGNFLNSGDPYENTGRVRTTPIDFYDTGGQDQAVHQGYTVHPGASPYGVENMAGNVWEWCQDWYGPYLDPHQPPTDGHFKILRGGAFNEPWSSATTWNRSYVDPETCDRAFGFRTAATAAP